MTNLFSSETLEALDTVEDWFSELKQVLGLEEEADKEEVLEEVRGLIGDLADYEANSNEVNSAFTAGVFMGMGQ
jgi:hypothetical protein